MRCSSNTLSGAPIGRLLPLKNRNKHCRIEPVRFELQNCRLQKGKEKLITTTALLGFYCQEIGKIIRNDRIDIDTTKEDLSILIEIVPRLKNKKDRRTKIKELELSSFEKVNIVPITPFVSSTIPKCIKHLINRQTAFRQRRILKKNEKRDKTRLFEKPLF